MKETLYLKKHTKKSDLRFFRVSSSRIDIRAKIQPIFHPYPHCLTGDILQCPYFSVRRAKFRVLSLKWYN